MMRLLTWKDKLNDWEQNPQELLSFIERQLLEAKIDIDDRFGYKSSNGKIELSGKVLDNKK